MVKGAAGRAAARRMGVLSAAARRMNVLSAALAFAAELVGIGVKKPRTGILSLKAQNHLSTRDARRIWRTKTRKAHRHH